MKRGSDVAAIRAAEFRVGQSGRDARDGLLRARAAIGANLARPSVLALAAGAGALLGFVFVRRPDPPERPSSAGTDVAGTASTASPLAAVILRYGLRYLLSVLRPAAAATPARKLP